MKNRNLLLATMATGAIFALTLSSASAMYGQGGGQGMGGQGKQTYSTTQGQAVQSGHDSNPGNLLTGVALQDLSDSEKDMLYYGYSEELLAHDMYMYFYELYGVQTFKNIADSESQHMEAVKVLLDRYGLDIPTDYGELTDVFANLKSEGEESLLKALEVGVKIETLDIDDISETIKTTDNNDFRIIFTNIGGGSYNHLRGFLTAINNAGLETDLDYSAYLTEDEVNTKGGTLKSKLAEKLEAEGIELPEQATATYIKANCTGTGTQNGGNMNKGQQGANMANANKYVNSNVVAMQARYKSAVQTKYQSKVEALSDAKLIVLSDRIDTLIEKINIGNYSTDTKEKYTAVLLNLKELVVDNIDDLDSEIESLFE